MTGSGESLLVTDRSACRLTVVFCVMSVLLAVVGSLSVAVAVALLRRTAPCAVEEGTG